MKPWLLVVTTWLALVGAATAEAMRTFVDDMGHTIEVPVQPQRIVSLRGEQFSAPLIELGAPIIGSSGRIDAGQNNGRPYVRGAYDALDFRFEGSGVAWVGTPNGYDFEQIAALDPDLIIIPDWDQDNYDKLSVIAPTAVIQVWGQSMLERYRKVADLAGMLPEFERLSRAYEDRLTQARSVLRDGIGDPSAVSVAVVEITNDKVHAYKDYGTLSKVLRDLGFSQPAFTANLDDARIEISPEMIHLIDADFMIGTYLLAFDQGIQQRRDEWDRAVPNWRDQLHAARHHQHFFIQRDEMRAVTFRSLNVVTSILLSEIAGREFVPYQP